MNALLLAKLGSFAQKYWMWFAFAILILLVLLLTYCAGGKGEVNKQQARTIEMQEKVGEANEAAAEARVADTERRAAEQQELNDAATKATSDADRRRRTGCVILRQQGRDISSIAACRGS